MGKNEDEAWGGGGGGADAGPGALTRALQGMTDGEARGGRGVLGVEGTGGPSVGITATATSGFGFEVVVDRSDGTMGDTGGTGFVANWTALLEELEVGFTFEANRSAMMGWFARDGVLADTLTVAFTGRVFVFVFELESATDGVCTSAGGVSLAGLDDA